MQDQILFLGTGTSSGVPIAACDCDTCRSSNPHDTRLNSSVLLIRDGFHLLIDCGPDFRHSAIAHRIDRVDAVWITHVHFDHYGGLDYLRIYNQRQKQAIPVYLQAPDAALLREHYLRYMFGSASQEGGGISQLDLRPLAEPDPVTIGPFLLKPIPVQHGRMTVWNLRIDDFAYLTDCSGIPDSSLEKLGGLDTLVLSALRYKAHPTHFNIDQSIAMTRRLNPTRAFFTHHTHDILHSRLTQELAEQIPEFSCLPAYDGLCLPAIKRSTIAQR